MTIHLLLVCFVISFEFFILFGRNVMQWIWWRDKTTTTTTSTTASWREMLYRILSRLHYFCFFYLPVFCWRVVCWLVLIFYNFTMNHARILMSWLTCVCATVRTLWSATDWLTVKLFVWCTEQNKKKMTEERTWTIEWLLVAYVNNNFKKQFYGRSIGHSMKGGWCQIDILCFFFFILLLMFLFSVNICFLFFFDQCSLDWSPYAFIVNATNTSNLYHV